MCRARIVAMKHIPVVAVVRDGGKADDEDAKEDDEFRINDCAKK